MGTAIGLPPSDRRHSLPRVTEPDATPEAARRMRITGLHHVSLISGDLQRTTTFYRDTLGLALVEQTTNDDDPDARHFWFGDAEGAAGTLISFLEYPQLPEGTVGVGSTHHLALAVESAEELEAWKEYLRGRDIQTTDVLKRGRFTSLYLRDPDGHIVELATRV